MFECVIFILFFNSRSNSSGSFYPCDINSSHSLADGPRPRHIFVWTACAVEVACSNQARVMEAKQIYFFVLLGVQSYFNRT
jgi:hypothetical protein